LKKNYQKKNNKNKMNDIDYKDVLLDSNKLQPKDIERILNFIGDLNGGELRKGHYRWLIDIFGKDKNFTRFYERPFITRWVAVRPWEEMEKILNTKDIIVRKKSGVRTGGRALTYMCLKSSSDRYFVKILRYHSTNERLFKIHMNELMVNAHVNLLAPYCPNFVKTHYITADVEGRMLDFKKLGNVSDLDKVYYIVMENLDDSLLNKLIDFSSLGQFKTGISIDGDSQMKFLKNMFIQLLFAKLCGNLIGFQHSDFFIGNVMLKSIEPTTLTLTFNDHISGQSNVFQIPDCEFIVKIIDFGNSTVDFPNLDDLTIQSKLHKTVLSRIFKKLEGIEDVISGQPGDLATLINHISVFTSGKLFNKKSKLISEFEKFRIALWKLSTEKVNLGGGRSLNYGKFVTDEDIFEIIGHEFFDVFRQDSHQVNLKHKVDPNFTFEYKKKDIYEKIPFDMGFFKLDQFCSTSSTISASLIEVKQAKENKDMQWLVDILS